MLKISSKQIKELSSSTGASLLNCRNALVACSGDYDRAFDELIQGHDFSGFDVNGKRICDLEDQVASLQKKYDELLYKYNAMQQYAEDHYQIDWSRYGMG